MNASRPFAVDVRELGLRDGLQIEGPVSTEQKVWFLESILATGVRRVEATAFVSPSGVPSMADAGRIAEHVAELASKYPDVNFSALVTNIRGAERATSLGICNLEFIVSASEGPSRANSGRSTAQAVDAVPEIAALVHSVGRSR